eukprot:TRINITY_DN15432_c0_g1_i1.p2 TRINITY_DN15432_c0_g1~~TRINITY_DN15432_c0_g1_i1.p2  ORF type:complete len:238 (+),score=60.29 TRINITY_DN15432_c0_g1_i1:80-715(+)
MAIAGINDISFKSMNTSEVLMDRSKGTLTDEGEQYSVFHRHEVSPEGESEAGAEPTPYYAYRLKCADDLHHETGIYLGMPCADLTRCPTTSPPIRPPPPLVRAVPLLSPPVENKESIDIDRESQIKDLTSTVGSLSSRVLQLEKQNQMLLEQLDRSNSSKAEEEEEQEDPRLDTVLSRMTALMEILNKKLVKQEKELRSLRKTREQKERKR